MMRIALTLTFLLAGGACLQARGETPAPSQKGVKPPAAKSKAAMGRKQARLKAKAAAEAKRRTVGTCKQTQQAVSSSIF